MKRVLQHPAPDAAGADGPRYWRSLDELADSPAFRQWLEREFPEGAAEMDAGPVNRRKFLALMGASAALAGAGLTGCRRPEAYLVPFTKTPEWLVPGKALHYSTAMPRRGGAMPLLATAFNGRPTKIEGNPLHPESLGRTDTFAQASVLDLYDPDRSTAFLIGGKPAAAAEFQAEIDRIRAQSALDGGAGLAVVVDGCSGPTRERLRTELEKQFPKLLWAAHDPLRPPAGGDADGPAVSCDLSKASVIFSLDCDFLGTGQGGLKAARDFTDGRRVRKPGDKMNRLYVAEPRFTITGGMADHRMRVRASDAGAFLAAVGRELAGMGGKFAELGRAAAGWPEFQTDERTALWIREMAKDLAAGGGKALVLAGAAQPPAVRVLALRINNAVGAWGITHFEAPNPARRAKTLADVAAAMGAGAVKNLVLCGVNPVYDGPADLDWAGLQAKVPSVLHLGDRVDETGAWAGLHAPRAHYLEAWGDAFAADSTTLCVQPLILPLHGGWSDIQMLGKLAGLAVDDGPGLVRETFAQRAGLAVGTPDFEEAWVRFVHDGFQAGEKAAASEARSATPEGAVPDLGPRVEGIEVCFAPDYSMDDGRYANNGWMQEWPDPITKLTWDNAALMSPATAKKLGVGSRVKDSFLKADVIRISLGGRSVEAPVLVAPGHADDSITLPLGYGRTKAGRVAAGCGFNAYALRTAAAPWFAGGAKIEKTGRAVELAVTQEHHAMEGRNHLREAPLALFEEQPDFVKDVGMDSHIPPNRSFYANPKLDGEHQWAMVIDMSTCTGCNACVVACQAENNIPIVGREQVINGREMHWIRIDRYFEGEPEDPEMLMQPVACMQCENAPCETVCPVNATVHNEEGLNVMAYNRCIGTRYCANNCPFKVRRFNFFDYNKRDVIGKRKLGPLEIGNLYLGPLGDHGYTETTKMQKNPNVTVRMRGVMEKCTFCVQRLEDAKITARVKAGASPDTKVPADSVKVACQQACPADAIVFGDKSHPDSRVTHLRALPQNYEMLKYLNLNTRVTYLPRLRNPNPAMPGADRVAASSKAQMHAHEGHAAHGAEAAGHGGHGHGAAAEAGHGGGAGEPAKGGH